MLVEGNCSRRAGFTLGYRIQKKTLYLNLETSNIGIVVFTMLMEVMAKRQQDSHSDTVWKTKQPPRISEQATLQYIFKLLQDCSPHWLDARLTRS